jgi:hypothetical protein
MARRLLVPVSLVFLVLLILGSLAPTDSTRTDTTTTPVPPAGGSPPRTVQATMPPNDEVRARVGDLVNITVESDTPGGVEMPDFGESEPVAPGAPAMFDVLPSEPGRFAVVSTDTGKQLGVLVVEGEAESGGAAAKPDDPA